MPDADLALIIALDCSASVTLDEFTLIADGCGHGLRDPAVIDGLTGGPIGASYCALLLWAGPGEQVVSVDWTRIASWGFAVQFATDVANTPRFGLGTSTAIGAALEACERMFKRLPGTATRQVIDVAGDGRANDGPAPGPIRDRLVAAGVTINGLCVLHDEPDLVESYTREVIGGPGAFALHCQDFSEFAEAMRQKLRQEVAAAVRAGVG